jgi:cyclopropane fatty-acyl-phospholipid synthase-like methyltransferase
MSDSASIVARYYDRVQWLYNLGWSAGGTRSLHYGLWWDDTRSLAEAIVNGDRFVADKLAVHASDHVLDMGCGVGGTSVFLAKSFGCRVTGITISRIQREQAAEYAAASGVGHLVQFELMDYTAMTFRDAMFTKAFTQESSNYAVDKRLLLCEAHRVLAPGGCYVALDAFQTRDARPGGEAARLRRVLRGWACAGLEPFDRYVALAVEVGLDVVESGDLSPRTARSARAIWRRHVFLYTLAYLAWRVGLAPAEILWHFQAAIEQKNMYCATDKLLMFGYLVARKPLYNTRRTNAEVRRARSSTSPGTWASPAAKRTS